MAEIEHRSGRDMVDVLPLVASFASVHRCAEVLLATIVAVVVFQYLQANDEHEAVDGTLGSSAVLIILGTGQRHSSTVHVADLRGDTSGFHVEPGLSVTWHAILKRQHVTRELWTA